MTTGNTATVTPFLSRLPAKQQAEILERQLEATLLAAKTVLAESEALVARAEDELRRFRGK